MFKRLDDIEIETVQRVYVPSVQRSKVPTTKEDVKKAVDDLSADLGTVAEVSLVKSVLKRHRGT